MPMPTLQQIIGTITGKVAFERTQANFTTIKDAHNDLETNVGTLASLTTLIKTSIVNAINSLRGELDEHKADMTTQLALKANKTQEAWITPTLQNGWQQGYSPRYRKNEFGALELRGTVTNGTTAAETVIFTLPVGYRPTVLQILAVASYDGAVASRNTLLIIRANGEVAIYGEASKNTIIMNGTVFL